MKALFGADGALARYLPEYEVRAEQIRMADRVLDALNHHHHLIIEAGTGVGKTLAYLLPLLHTETSAVISTATKVLQHQLLEKDIPLVCDVTGMEPDVAILKGRSNYLCLLRQEQMAINPLFETPAEIPVWPVINAWSEHTETGDFEELEDIPPRNSLLQKLNADRNYCTGSKCPFFDRCHFYQARRRAMRSDIVLVNHHLLFSDLSVKESRVATILPSHPVLIVDEAHRLEDIASAQFGQSLTPRMLGVLTAQLPGELKLKYRQTIRDYLSEDQIVRFSGEVKYRRAMSADLRKYLSDLDPLLGKMLHDLKQVDQDTFELRDNLMTRIKGFQDFLGTLEDEGAVPLVDREGHQLAFRTVPIDVSNRIETAITQHFDTVIMTSATLSVNGSLDFFRSRVGLEQADQEVLTSPFPYKENTRLYIPEKIPDVNDPAFVASAMDVLEPILEGTGGRAFLLCTSHRNVDAFAGALRERTEWNVLKQGEGSPAGLVGRFMMERHSVLVGSFSFWEGVDVKGEGLVCVVLDRLPFPRPDDPVFKARSHRTTHPFRGYSLPLAVLQYKQGLGRLVRSRSDKGVYVVLDRRLRDRSYGKVFLDSFYDTEVVRDASELQKFVEEF